MMCIYDMVTGVTGKNGMLRKVNGNVYSTLVFIRPFPDCISNFSKFAMDNANNSMYKHYAIIDGVCCCAKCEHMWRLRSEVKVGKQCPHCGAMLITKNKFINKGDN